MNIWLVNPFDPLPGDPEQEGRYATLVRLLAARGHQVTWWTSSFSHRFKRAVDQAATRAACEALNVRVEFLDGPAYRRNVGLGRLWNHHLLARRFAAAAPNHPPPEALLASTPPPLLALAAARFAQSRGLPLLLDIQDLWPETFRRLAPTALLPAFKLLLRPWARAARKAAAAADAIFGVADAYVQRGLELGGAKPIAQTVPLGVDLAAFDAAAQAGRCERFTKPAGEVWMTYAGSLNRSYDCLTFLRAFAQVRGGPGRRVRLFITSRGELSGRMEQLVRRDRLKEVEFTRFLDFSSWAFLLSQCDVGINSAFPEAMVFLPNKVFYYLAAGLAVLNAIPGQCSRIVLGGGCGLDYQAGNVESCAETMRRILSDAAQRSKMRRAARGLAETVYDRAILYPKYADLIEAVRRTPEPAKQSTPGSGGRRKQPM